MSIWKNFFITRDFQVDPKIPSTSWAEGLKPQVFAAGTDPIQSNQQCIATSKGNILLAPADGASYYVSEGGRFVTAVAKETKITTNHTLKNYTTFEVDTFFPIPSRDQMIGYLTDDYFYLYEIGASQMSVLQINQAMPVFQQVQLSDPIFSNTNPEITAEIVYAEKTDQIHRLYVLFQDTGIDRGSPAWLKVYDLNSPESPPTRLDIGDGTYPVLKIVGFWISAAQVVVVVDDEPNASCHVYFGQISDTAVTLGSVPHTVSKRQHVQSLWQNATLYLLVAKTDATANRFELYSFTSATAEPQNIPLPPEPSGKDVSNLNFAGVTKNFFNWTGAALMFNTDKKLRVALGLNAFKIYANNTSAKKLTVNTIVFELCESGYCVDLTTQRPPCIPAPVRNACISKCHSKPGGIDGYSLFDSADCQSINDDCRALERKCDGAFGDVYTYNNGEDSWVCPFNGGSSPSTTRTLPGDAFDEDTYSCKMGTVYYGAYGVNDWYQNTYNESNKDALDSLCMLNPDFKSKDANDPNGASCYANLKNYQFVCDYTACIANRAVSIDKLSGLTNLDVNASFPDTEASGTSDCPLYTDKAPKNCVMYLDPTYKNQIDNIIADTCATSEGLTSTSCKTWCNDVIRGKVPASSNDYANRCDAAAAEYCSKDDTSNDPFCACVNSKDFLSECFDSKCTNSPIAYNTQNMYKITNGGHCPAVCDTIIDVNQVGGNVQVDNNEFDSQCSQNDVVSLEAVPDSSPHDSGPPASVPPDSAASVPPALTTWYTVSKDGKCTAAPGLGSEETAFYQKCVLGKGSDCNDQLKKLLAENKSIPSQKYYSSLIACEQASEDKFKVYLGIAIFSVVAGLPLLIYGIAKKQKQYWIPGTILLVLSTVFFVLYSV